MSFKLKTLKGSKEILSRRKHFMRNRQVKPDKSSLSRFRLASVTIQYNIYNIYKIEVSDKKKEIKLECLYYIILFILFIIIIILYYTII